MNRKDLAWDGESKRIIAVGEGRDKSVYHASLITQLRSLCVHRFGHAFMVDSGSSTGEIIGHSKVAMKLPLARLTRMFCFDMTPIRW